MGKENFIDKVVNNVVNNNTSKDEKRVRNLIFHYWALEEEKHNIFMCLGIEDYEMMVEKIYSQMNKNILRAVIPPFYNTIKIIF